MIDLLYKKTSIDGSKPRSLNHQVRSRHVAQRSYKVKVQKVEDRSETYRATIPQVVAAILDLQKGDELVWIVDPATRRVTVERGASSPPKTTERRSR